VAIQRMKNYIGGEWVDSSARKTLDVINPATAEKIAVVPLSGTEEVNRAVQAAVEAFAEWRETPPLTRARCLFRLKNFMEERFDDLARTIVEEEGKTLDEAAGEVRRAVENVETATGITSLMMGYNLEDVAAGIDEYVIRQPVGVFAVIPPFNFPLMVPLWFLPMALACGNTVVLKPSEQVPVSQARLFELMDEAGFPPGVVNLVNGGAATAQALIENPDVKGVSFVGSSRVARLVYEKAAARGKRVQCQGGAKNFLVVMPDADLERAVPGLITSVYGCSGQRCLSGSVLLAVGGVYNALKEKFVAAASNLKVGYGLDETTQMGPLVSREQKERVLKYIEIGLREGAELILDGRGVTVEGYPDGFFLGPTVFDRVTPDMTIAKEEIFGPVACIMKAESLNEAIRIIQGSPYGNASSIFTSSGESARTFRYRVPAGNVGINIGIAAPMSFFPFGGMKDSFFGDLHGQGPDAVNFFTERKVVIERWL